MPRSFSAAAILLGLAALATSGCGTTTTTPTTPTATSPSITEIFTGRVTQNGSVSFPFIVTTGGGLSLTLQSLDPDPTGTAAVGISLGTWNGTVCAVTLSNDNASTGSVVLGTAAGAGSLCARVADSTGTLTAPITFSIAIVHF